MSWKEWSPWRKGGVIGAGIFVIYYLLLAIGVSSTFPSRCILNWDMPFYCHLAFPGMHLSDAGILQIVFVLIGWIVYGMIVGWIVGKIKGKK